jgi:argininosuccinate lyase
VIDTKYKLTHAVPRLRKSAEDNRAKYIIIVPSSENVMTQNIIRKGRLADIDERASHFISSIVADAWLFHYDILVDLAHLRMLQKQSIIAQTTFQALKKSLLNIKERGYALLPKDVDDVHIAIETALMDDVGTVEAGWLHVGRSRNDEVATCIRMALRDKLLLLTDAVLSLQSTLLKLAAANQTTLMPGFTHLQHAQPTTLGHHLLAHYDALERDLARLGDCYARTNQSPLGAAAFASTGWPLDRDVTASALGFDGIIENSMDAVSSRDFVIEALATASNLMMTLSRLAEELILWSTSEFGYIELDDTFASTSSIMPQKKNPDPLELTRAKTGTVVGALTASLVICKALPYSYNLDLQEVTPHLHQAMSTAVDCTQIVDAILQTILVNKDRLVEMSSEGFTTATELADTIARATNVPFRTAHTIVGEVARIGKCDLDTIDQVGKKRVGKLLSDLGLTADDVREALDVTQNVAKRNVKGGPATSEVARMIKARSRRLRSRRRRLSQQKKGLQMAEKGLLYDSGA